MTNKTEVTRDDILPMEEYGKMRKAHRAELVQIKRHRRVSCGPFATFYFENYHTMWSQIHEMLYIERGGEEQIQDELDAYNPLIPKGKELIATFMIEIEDKPRRQRELAKLGGIEETFFVKVGEQKIIGESEKDVDRTTADGKASSVQFVHFEFSDEQIAAFRDGSVDVAVGVGHPEYNHMAILNREQREALAQDFTA
ncbi:MAG: DUF3501 family protein [Ectothiorhodospiraceae bacterium]|nr:DUF3501 family protein [Ectothiorhodospiraceae bacterium]MCH8505806.1 DUF3501 family protein [Ectothiorhodospiraceae bacterium]